MIQASRFAITIRTTRTRLAALLASSALLAAAGMAVLAGASASAAAADTFNTTYYTINVKAPYTGAVTLFLASTAGDNVRTARYKSGDPTLQWTATYPEWPATAPITGTAGFGSGSCSLSGCSFSGHGDSPPLKLVNRATALCLTRGFRAGHGVRAVLLPCVSRAGSARDAQTWRLRDIFAGEIQGALPRKYTDVAQRRGSRFEYLDFAFIQYAPGTSLTTSRNIKSSWSGDYRFLRVAEVSCGLSGAINKICGLPPRR
jgi:hypothetical protein